MRIKAKNVVRKSVGKIAARYITAKPANDPSLEPSCFTLLASGKAPMPTALLAS
jgi:hypothetical protein